MNRYVTSLLLVGAVLTGSMAFAESYKGFYQFKDAKGLILYQGYVGLKTKSLSDNKTERTYEELTEKGLKKVVCIVETKNLSNHTSSWVETCPDYVQSSVCQNNKCSGMMQTATMGDLPASSVEGNEVKSLVLISVQPVNYLGIKNIKSINQVLKLDKSGS